MTACTQRLNEEMHLTNSHPVHTVSTTQSIMRSYIKKIIINKCTILWNMLISISMSNFLNSNYFVLCSHRSKPQMQFQSGCCNSFAFISKCNFFILLIFYDFEIFIWNFRVRRKTQREKRKREREMELSLLCVTRKCYFVQSNNVCYYY